MFSSIMVKKAVEWRLVSRFVTGPPADLVYPEWLRIAGYGNVLFVTDVRNKNVKVFTFKGVFKQFLEGLDDPTDVAIGDQTSELGIAKNKILVADAGIKGIVIFNEDYSQLKLLKNVYKEKARIAYATSINAIVLADECEEQITFIDMQGVILRKIDKTSLCLYQFHPYDVAMSPDGQTLATTDINSSCVYVIDIHPTGESATRRYSPGGSHSLSDGRGLCIDRQGVIIVVNTGKLEVFHKNECEPNDRILTYPLFEDLVDPSDVASFMNDPQYLAVVEKTGQVKLYQLWFS